MEWSSTAITWDLQVMVMWLVLPLVFIFCGFLTLVLPVLLAPANRYTARRDEALPQRAARESGR
jgi:hypothetical protein